MTQTATASGTLTVMANLPLSVSLIVNPTTINLGQSVTLTASVTGGTGPYSYIWTNLPSPCSGTSNTTTCTPNVSGMYNISVQVKDTTGATVSATGTLVVNPATVLSVSMTISPTTISLGQSITFSATATGGVTPYSYGWSGLPSGCTVGNVNSFTCTPTATGVFTITVSVTDSSLLTACSTGIIHISPPISTNLVQNPGFEITSIAPNIPANWRTYGVGTPSFSYPQPGRIGGVSVEITYASASTEAAWLQDISIGTLNRTKQYTLSGWINTQNISGTGGANIQIEWFNGSTYISYTPTNIFKGTTWTQLSVTIPPNTIPSGANIARVMCKLGNCTGSAWFDDISFIAVN